MKSFIALPYGLRWNRVVAITGDCKSPANWLRRFESYFQHHMNVNSVLERADFYKEKRPAIHICILLAVSASSQLLVQVVNSPVYTGHRLLHVSTAALQVFIELLKRLDREGVLVERKDNFLCSQLVTQSFYCT